MSDNPKHGAHTIRASQGGGKWLLGAVAAALLLGGGYFAWQTYTNSNPLQAAHNDGYAEEPYDDALRAGPLEPDSVDEESEASEPNAAPAPAPAARHAQAAPVPEAIIGVTPASVNAEDAAAAADDGEIVVTAPPRPVWVRTPSERRLTSLYPARALERGREGEARLHCIVQDDGALQCEKLEETPGGGFGNAALRVARTLRHAPRRADGSDATGSPVNLRVVFRIEDEPPRG